ncbi:Orsellinic acid synthase [Sparassis crispa]|uniref:Orsellinic acid synthase n=1 Tax=Sparassis crispa TaxID=139825 RepID=A0A401GFG2_9APHY|nr:Orsellinic acid synthase [Sparassis crispa]GBE80926.1 Orsellinic acid synthase [Sparassis crispa]
MTQSLPYNAFLFDGQGTPASFAPQTIATALRDAELPLGSALLLACHQAFLHEFQSLSPDEQSVSGLDIPRFSSPRALLHISLDLRSNAIVANTHLFLVQVLRYLAAAGVSSPGSSGFSTEASNFIGFSSGMFAATVVAASQDIPSFLVNAVETFRLAFWLGLRSQQFASSTLSLQPSSDASAPWSFVFFGAPRDEVQRAVDSYNQNQPSGPVLHLTAVTHATCVSVSGRPEALSEFRANHLLSTSSKSAAIHTLYHSSQTGEVKDRIMADIARRNIRFPTYDALKHSLRSTVDGEIISGANHGFSPTLVEAIVDMTMLHPVNFDRVIAAISSDPAVKDRSLRLMNIGPGTSLWRGMARSLQDLDITVVDWTSIADSEGPSNPVPRALVDSAPSREPIAIIGMAVNLPGAPDINGLWEVLEKGLNTVSEIPKRRFDVSKYTTPSKDLKRVMKTRFGNFIESPDAFDNVFFRVSPREARSMDPQQRVLLQVTYHALENAGYVPNATPCFNPDTFATYVGVATNDYVQNLRNDIDVYYSTGTLQSFLSGKVSYAFGFSGPSLVIDTACSSSMVSIYQACRALNNGDCNAAIAGGVNVIASPDMYFGLDRAHFLSSTGQCRPWDSSADGYCRSEGCGMFVLKRLSDALAEQDNILGVIRGIEVNQSANAESITHPHVPTQTQLFKKLLASTGIQPSRISVIEAHGTGTKAGDPTELESLRNVFAVNRTAENQLHITSVKANIGHAEAASGAAGLAKLLLMMRKRTIPAVISLKQLNPRIPELSIDGTCIDTRLTPWSAPADGDKRLALLNNFGAAGSNGALILEEPPVPQSSGTASAPTAVVVGFSCDSEAAAAELRRSYLQYVDESVHDQLSLADFAYTATARRKLYRYRVAASGKTKAELCANLKDAKMIEVEKSAGKTVFVFSGQGGQYVGMGANLYKSTPAFRRIVDECHSKLISWGYPSILSVIRPSGDADSASADSFEVFQSAVFVLEYALASLWMSWGVRPDAVAGHSLGEYAALVTANVITIDDALKLVAERARLMSQKCAPKITGMLAVRVSPSKMTEILKSANYQSLSIACYNSTADCVLGGNLDELKLLQGELKQAGNKTILLNVPYGYHTSAMSPILQDLCQLGNQVKISAPTIPIVSNVYGVVVAPGDHSKFTPDYFSRHCGEPVQFEQGVTSLMGIEEFAKVSAWIEIGPHPTTLPMLRSIPLASQNTLHLPSLRKDILDWETLCGTLSSLYCAQTSLSWRSVFTDLAQTARLVDLPSYPFADTRFWVQYEDERPTQSLDAPVTKAAAPPRFSLLGTCISVPPPDVEEAAVFETPIEILSHLIEGHLVAGFALCPASVYHELALGAAHILLEKTGKLDPDVVLDLSEIVYANPLVYSSEVRRTIRVEVTPYERDEKHTGKFTIGSWVDTPSDNQAHCSGFFVKRSATYASSKLALSKTMIERRIQPMQNGSPASETFFTQTAYNVIFSRVVQYSKAYHTMKSVTIDPNGVDAFAVVKLPPEASSGQFVVHPIFMDTLLHVAGFVINCNAGQNEAFICSQVDKAKAIPELINPSTTYGVYCNIGFLSETLAVADAYAIELDGTAGNVVAHMKRMRFRKLRMPGFKSLLARVARGSSQTHAAPAISQPGNRVPAATQGWEDKLIGLIAETCDVNVADIKLQSRLSDLGIDSLMSIELAGRIQALLPSCDIDANAVASFNRVGDLVLELKDKCGSSTSASSDTLHDSDIVSPPPTQVSSPRTPDSLLKIKEIMSSILGVAMRDLSEDQDLERLGLDSLTSIEARHALQSSLNVNLAEDVFMICKTIRDIDTAVSAMLSPPSDVPKVHPKHTEQSEKPALLGTEINPVRLQEGSSAGTLPLFLIHDGSGMAHPYARLSPLGRPLWGIHNPKLPTGDAWDGGVLEMASHYVELIKAASGTTGCIVGGWSFGGVLAFEVARQLIRSGIRVPGIVLIDSPHPLTKSPLPDSLIENVIGGKGSTNKLTELVRAQMRHATRALISYDLSQSPASGVLPPKAVMLRSQEAFSLPSVETESAAFLAERGDPASSVAQWEKVLGVSVPVIDIPGNHFEPFEPRYVGVVSEKLKEAVAMLD